MNRKKRPLTFALVGNPNCGKTTLFNALTGSSAYVGNWPGVTVEKKIGHLQAESSEIDVVDLPGIYSLSAYSPEEALAERFLREERPDLIINIVDASNLERNFYLTTQLMELKRPMVIALNMMDVAERRGERINCPLLSALTGVGVVPVTAAKGKGLPELLHAGMEALGKPTVRRSPILPPHGSDPDLELAEARYRYIESLTKAAVKKNPSPSKSRTEKIDAVATNRFFAIPSFFATILFIFWLTFGSVGSLLVQLVESFLTGVAVPAVDGALRAIGTSVWVRSLILDGILAGVGAVLKFLPQILLLFLLLSLLEDSGYMARAAFIMDAPMRKIGLSGRAFVPLLMGFGCTVPAVMGTRILEQEKDKRLTILITPFMSCSAKMPVYTMVIAAFFAGSRPLIMFLLYLFGICMGILSALLLKKSVLKGEPAPFVMELPDYRLPTPKSVWLHVKRRMLDFLQKAGTTVFAATVLIWLLQSLTVGLRMTADSSQSILAAGGKLIAPIFTLCGFNSWQTAVALLTGLVAKESIVSTISVLFAGNVTAALQQNFTTLSACSFLVFVLLYTPCAAALSTIRRETGSIKWAAASAAYQFATAWYCSALLYQCGLLIMKIFS